MNILFCRTFVLTTLTLFLAVFAVPALAQDKPSDNMEILKEKIKADKKLVVAVNMNLTESESKAFWPVYESYQKELASLDERTIKLIQKYADNYGAMSDEVARKLMDEYMEIEAGRLKLRQSYLPKLRKILPEIKVARYYQIENKIHAVAIYELARKIPLAK